MLHACRHTGLIERVVRRLAADKVEGRVEVFQSPALRTLDIRVMLWDRVRRQHVVVESNWSESQVMMQMRDPDGFAAAIVAEVKSRAVEACGPGIFPAEPKALREAGYGTV